MTLKSSLCDYSDAYILAKETISVVITLAAGIAANNNGVEGIFKSSTPFTDCINEINNTQTDNTKDIDVVMPLYDLIQCNDNYSKTTRSLWQYYKGKPDLSDPSVIGKFSRYSALFKFKQKITGETENNGTINAEIMVPLKNLSNFWRTLEMPIINCEINLILAWSENWVISNTTANQVTTFAITDTKLYEQVCLMRLRFERYLSYIGQRK